MARRDIDRYKESRAEADALTLQAESELVNAKRTARDLSSWLKESDSKAMERKREIETLKKSTRKERRTLTFGKMESQKYLEVKRELEDVKQELRMLKLDMAAVLEEKSRAQKQIQASRTKIVSRSRSLEAVKKEIEEANEEQVLVELAGIEALKEYGQIEAERRKEASRFANAIEQTRGKINDIADEIEHSKELESKLAITMADVDALQNELRSVKEMERRVQRNDSLGRSKSSFRRGEELVPSLSLQSATEELEAAKKELALVKEEGFQYMASMDIIRNELKHVKKETVRLEETEKKEDLTVQNLNSKLLRAKAKLEAVSAAEEKAKSIVSNLSLTLEQHKIEAEAARKEKALVVQEAATIKSEIRRTESEIDSTEKRLQAAMQELEAAKSSEALALEDLRSLIEITIGARTSVLQHSSTITISKFEYNYLTGRAVGAEELADKKVAAAQAWIEAIKANEKEILMKIDFAQREIKEMRLEEEKESYRMERSFSAKRTVERELQSWRTKREKNATPENLQLSMHKKSMRGNGNENLTPSRRPKFRKSVSPAGRNTFPVKKRTRVMPNFAKFFKGKTENSF